MVGASFVCSRATRDTHSGFNQIGDYDSTIYHVSMVFRIDLIPIL